MLTKLFLALSPKKTKIFLNNLHISENNNTFAASSKTKIVLIKIVMLNLIDELLFYYENLF